MAYASKLVHNTNNYNSVTGVAQTGIFVNNNKKPYYFGLEEWNNQKTLKQKKVAYIDSYRAFNRIGIAERIALFSFNPINTNVYHCGNLYGVRQLENKEIPELREYLNQNNWLNIVGDSFNEIGDVRPINEHTEYMRCWNSNNIVASTGKGFILNISYKKLELFEPENWVNLTHIIPEVNVRWHYLRQRYTLPIEWEQFF